MSWRGPAALGLGSGRRGLPHVTHLPRVARIQPSFLARRVSAQMSAVVGPYLVLGPRFAVYRFCELLTCGFAARSR
jgi:hypothetical protein